MHQSGFSELALVAANILTLCSSATNPTNLVEEEIGVDVVLSQVARARWAAALVLQVRDNAGVAESVATRCDEGIINRLHADWAA